MHIYLDNNATTQVCKAVISEMLPLLQENFGNPSSTHFFGQNAANALKIARGRVADILNCEPRAIVFTGSGTEANNLALTGTVAKFAELHNAPGHIITSSVEHSSILNVCKMLEGKSVKITYLPVDPCGAVNPDDLRNSITDQTFLISVMLANNETGTVQDIRKLAGIAHKSGILFHTDAIQALGKVEVDVETLGVDMLSISAHKIHGPKGAGALFVRKGAILQPLILGGGQEEGVRAGTENMPAIAGFGKACELVSENLNENIELMLSLKKYLTEQILKYIPHAFINSCGKSSLPNTLNVSFPGLDSESIATRLNEKGVAVGTGSACRSSAPGVSHVLKAMGVPPEVRYSAIRLSVSKYNRMDEIDQAVKALTEIVNAATILHTKKESPQKAQKNPGNAELQLGKTGE